MEFLRSTPGGPGVRCSNPETPPISLPDRVRPEKDLVQVLTSDGANEPLGKGMGYRHMGNGFNPINFSNPQIGFPLVVAEQGIVV